MILVELNTARWVSDSPSLSETQDLSESLVLAQLVSLGDVLMDLLTHATVPDLSLGRLDKFNFIWSIGNLPVSPLSLGLSDLVSTFVGEQLTLVEDESSSCSSNSEGISSSSKEQLFFSRNTEVSDLLVAVEWKWLPIKVSALLVISGESIPLVLQTGVILLNISLGDSFGTSSVLSESLRSASKDSSLVETSSSMEVSETLGDFVILWWVVLEEISTSSISGDSSSFSQTLVVLNSLVSELLLGSIGIVLGNTWVSLVSTLPQFLLESSIGFSDTTGNLVLCFLDDWLEVVVLSEQLRGAFGIVVLNDIPSSDWASADWVLSLVNTGSVLLVSSQKLLSVLLLLVGGRFLGQINSSWFWFWWKLAFIFHKLLTELQTVFKGLASYF